MAGLDEYRRKRDFAKTPEPRGGTRRRRAGLAFVVQKHAATRLHYDFRLEWDGVLKSWAVPKGPSLDPEDKRLAMRTEDHPIEYGDFEGIIPEGEYGGGTVLLWDRGTWEPEGDAERALRAGRLRFELHGEKLRGAWNLVRIRGRERRDAEKTWLLIKGRDAEARADVDLTDTAPASVASGRSLEEIAAREDRVWHSNRPARSGVPPRRPKRRAPPRPNLAAVAGARAGPMPATVEPQLATLVGAPPAGDGWLHEMKFDGYRILCRIADGAVELRSRNGKDWTDRFPMVAGAARALGLRTALIDGEVAVVLPDGTTSFNALQNLLTGEGRGTLVYFVFDLVYLDGFDLRATPLEERKTLLRTLLGAGAAAPVWRFSEHVAGSGEDFFRQACRLGLEGVVSKRRNAPYTAGRGRDWQKVKCIHEQEFVVGGFTDPEGRRSGIGALLLGVHEDERLAYVGKVGTGFSNASAVALRNRLEPLATPTCPFGARPPGTRDAHWVRPSVVVEVEFTEWTPDGRLRHPSFKGIREDKPATAIVRERPSNTPSEAAERRRPAAGRTRATAAGASAAAAAARTEVAGVALSHAERVLYPAEGITKLGLARFYEAIADRILPHVVDRPTTLVRCPEGLAEPCFYQKHTGIWAPAQLRRVRIREKTKVGEYLVVDDLPGLVALVQIGILEIHTWNARTDDLERPDRLVFDLDPAEDVPWAAVVAAAHTLREHLRADGLESFVKTTGGKGLHLLVPIERGPGWDACLAYARAFAERLVREAPTAFVTTMAKARRRGRILIDVLRNLRGNTSVAAYSTRAHPGAPVSTPLAWAELRDATDPARYTVQTLPRRLARLREDPWAGFASVRQSLPGTRTGAKSPRRPRAAARS